MNIPKPILGTAMWGWTTPKSTCFELLDAFYAAGHREVDAATNYPINKVPADFRRSETILHEWIKAHGIEDLEVMMKVGSLNNMRSPDHNLSPSFLLINWQEYKAKFGSNLKTFMVHWDNRSDALAVAETVETLVKIKSWGARIGFSGLKFPAIYEELSANALLDPLIQIKHNILQSHYDWYAAFHGKPRFITYGINAGGLKLKAAEYNNNSSLSARGDQAENYVELIEQCQKIVDDYNATQPVTHLQRFNDLSLIYALYHPDIYGILLGTSNKDQLINSLTSINAFAVEKLGGVYKKLKALHALYLKP